MDRIIVSKELRKICPFGQTTIWRWEKKGLFPKRRRIGGCVGWLESEIRAFMVGLPQADAAAGTVTLPKGTK